MSQMRTVHHPIAAFVLAVVVVIGIGVGLVAATTHQKGLRTVLGPVLGGVYFHSEPSAHRKSGLQTRFSPIASVDGLEPVELPAPLPRQATALKEPPGGSGDVGVRGEMRGEHR